MATRTSDAFASATVNGYTVKTTPNTSALAGATDEIVSVSIATNTDAVENKKIVAGCEIDSSNQYSNVAAHLIWEVSHNGTDWATAVDMSTDITPDVAGVRTFLVDLTDIYAPYMRMRVNGGLTTGKATITSLSMGTTGQMKFFFAYK
tara:strand:- start:12007 stop:12450 length:444 start_codon:yes stop_codon:yes gene_type:complete